MGFEPTTASLEGWNSTTELRPHISWSLFFGTLCHNEQGKIPYSPTVFADTLYITC